MTRTEKIRVMERVGMLASGKLSQEDAQRLAAQIERLVWSEERSRYNVAEKVAA